MGRIKKLKLIERKWIEIRIKLESIKLELMKLKRMKLKLIKLNLIKVKNN